MDATNRKRMEALGLSTDPNKQPHPELSGGAISVGLTVVRVESIHDFLRYQITRTEIRDTMEAYYRGNPGPLAGYRVGPKQQVRRLIGFGSTEAKALDMARQWTARHLATEMKGKP